MRLNIVYKAEGVYTWKKTVFERLEGWVAAS